MYFNGKDELIFHFGTGPIIVRRRKSGTALVFRLPGSIGELSAKRKTGCGRDRLGVRATAGRPQTGA